MSDAAARRDVIGAMVVGPRATPARTFPPGRACEEPGCRVRLSVYNPSTVCGVHARFEAATQVARPVRRERSGRAGVFRASRVAA
jgi:hypothetical protein